MNSEPTNESSPSLSGQLLLASPALHDPNFARSVVFMAAHNAKEGAFGYILNRPLEQRVADLLPDQDLGSLGEVPVFMGGPVATDKLAFAALHWNKKRRTLRCQTTVLTVDTPAQMWSAILEELGPVYKVMAKIPEDVGLN